MGMPLDAVKMPVAVRFTAVLTVACHFLDLQAALKQIVEQSPDIFQRQAYGSQVSL